MRKVLRIIATPFVWYCRSIARRRVLGLSWSGDSLGAGNSDFCEEGRDLWNW